MGSGVTRLRHSIARTECLVKQEWTKVTLACDKYWTIAYRLMIETDVWLAWLYNDTIVTTHLDVLA